MDSVEPAPDGQPRTLILLRHAKSDYPGGTRDFDRPLAHRGDVEAHAAGQWIAEHTPPVDQVLCSAALRTRQTLAATGIDAPTDFRDEIYDASPDEILALVREVGDDVQTLLVVGHAPGIPSLAQELSGDGSDPVAWEDMGNRFPTSSLAVLAYRGAWADLQEEAAVLTAFEVARTSHS